MAKSNRDGFEVIALPHIELVFRVAMTYCHDPARADDLVQETYLKAFKRFESFRNGTNIKAWLLRIMHNTWIDLLRHRKVVGPTVPVEEQRLAHPQPDGRDGNRWSNPQELLENFSDEQIIKALRDLGEEQRLSLYLVDVEGFSHEDVAAITDVAVGTVKSRTSRARHELKRRLESHARDLGFLDRVS
jgi:RNA polymerase sigma-70 factor (ECF subfamily)